MAISMRRALRQGLMMLCGLPLWAVAQDATLKGKVINPDNDPISQVKIEVLTLQMPLVFSATDGKYELRLPKGKHRILFTHVGFDSAVVELEALEYKTFERNIKLVEFSTETVVISNQKKITDFNNIAQMERMDAKQLMAMANATSVEKAIGLMTGGNSNEFSSQYRVRGGNFDENLVYVNGIEVYRPFLVRSGQQEGLGFTNPALVQDIQFSTGGFAANYGDKLSSVLDITYRDPQGFRGTAEVGILTTNVHLEGRSRNRRDSTLPGRVTFLMGARRFQASYFLKGLDTDGDYQPSFYDIQSMLTYTPRMKERGRYKIRSRANGGQDTIERNINPLKITVFATTSRNRYYFEPKGREATFGMLQAAFRLRVAFEGREYTSYTTGLAAVKFDYAPTNRFTNSFIITAFRTQEAEVFDVEGGYMLGEVNTNIGNDNFNQADFDLGIGSEFRHARNYLTANVLSAQYLGFWNTNNQRLRWGASFQQQFISDEIKEYRLIDSAGYVVNRFAIFGTEEYIKGSATLNGIQPKAFIQHEWRIGKAAQLTSGCRAAYFDLIGRTMISPRAQFQYDFTETASALPLRLRAAAGVYQQPPFYREFRRLDGSLNLNIQQQKAYHYIIGADYKFKMWKRDFRLFSEVYYKYLANVIPYEIDNVRIRYYPDYKAVGEAYGIDLRIFGQFVKGVDSWASLNILKTSENAFGDNRGYISRPTDQRVGFSTYFQDELPIDPTFKVHMNYVYNSGMHIGFPRNYENRTNFQLPSYQRVDIGFSKIFSFNSEESMQFRRGVESVWATLEVYNLFGRNNTVSYNWIQDVNNIVYGVPNYLSARLLNVRVVMKFR